MKRTDTIKFSMLMALMGELYHKTITEELTEIYWNTLQKFDINEIQRAIKQHIGDPDMGKFMPKPADLIQWMEGSR